ncbi:putative integral membrane protein (TIGR00698 family) [Flavobacterium limicola]|uniref:Putative integral membrane protein (TIGR00698 family) n=1 Tax=Flavobacterium limicola TaxID=180441 RepID=A0A495S359_9FLAO|nr:putative sulfate exporter family transporter [Flavobacterium limicola]RKS94101.1 putative integral membrane protein (TIGR00698 family) [Flavobacterium limicola]
METHQKVIQKESFIFFKVNAPLQQLIFVVLLLFCTTIFVSPPIALVLGLIVANLFGHPFLELNHKATNYLLQFSVVGLGFGMNVHSAVSSGKEGFLFTIISIVSTLVLGTFLGKWFKTDTKTSHLISCGTAICGGSAIAAIAPVIKSNEKQTSVALGVIFILNSVALFLFPAVGHWLDLTQKEFGLWCAIAIHDTSSVVGAASKFGPEALQIATTVKLARALWIIPVALITAIIFKNKSGKIKIPYFIGLFILAMIANIYLPEMDIIGPHFVSVAKIGLTITMFLIGAGLNRNVLKSVGLKPLAQGILLWTFIAIATLVSIIYLK